MIVKQKLHKVINIIYEKSVHGYFEQIAKGKQILKKCGKRISQSIHSVQRWVGWGGMPKKGGLGKKRRGGGGVDTPMHTMVLHLIHFRTLKYLQH